MSSIVIVRKAAIYILFYANPDPMDMTCNALASIE
jgi:hypothetical protein